MKLSEKQDLRTSRIVPEINTLQLKKLRSTASHAYENSSYWKNVFDSLDIDPRLITIDDYLRLPVISKEDVQQNIIEMTCVSKEKIIDYVSTSGTTSSPVIIPLTEKDLERLAENEYTAISRTGATNKDIFQICTTLDKQFMAGMAYFLGLRKLGAGIVRIGVESLEMQWQTIFQVCPSYLIAVPSFVIKLISYAIKNNIDYKKSSVKKIICIGENIRDKNFELNTIGQRITRMWDVKLYSTYASTEMATAFTECNSGIGGHQNNNLLITEILNEKNNPVPYGDLGELTITTLDVEGMPLFRYKTGDLCVLHSEPCSCGTSTNRISPILGRTGQRIKYKGTSLYASTIIDIINQFDGVKDFIIVLETTTFETDSFIIHLVVNHKDLAIEIKEKLKTVLRVSPEIIIQRSLLPLKKQYALHNKRKISRVLDNRRL